MQVFYTNKVHTRFFFSLLGKKSCSLHFSGIYAVSFRQSYALYLSSSVLNVRSCTVRHRRVRGHLVYRHKHLHRQGDRSRSIYASLSTICFMQGKSRVISASVQPFCIGCVLSTPSLLQFPQFGGLKLFLNSTQTSVTCGHGICDRQPSSFKNHVEIIVSRPLESSVTVFSNKPFLFIIYLFVLLLDLFISLTQRYSWSAHSHASSILQCNNTTSVPLDLILLLSVKNESVTYQTCVL